MYALVVKFQLRDETSAAAWDKLVAETSEGIRDKEPGTLVYVTHEVEGEPLSRVFYEVYRDRAAFEEHNRQPHIRRFSSERDQYLSARRVEFLTPQQVKGVPMHG